jgi:hypothetical protein
MNYVNFEDLIVQRYCIDLVGWPANLKFVNPSEMSDSLAPLQELSTALSDGTCKFVVLSPTEQSARRERVAADKAAGRIVPRKPRKQRKDAGVARGRRKSSVGGAIGTSLEIGHSDVDASADEGEGMHEDESASHGSSNKRQRTA